MNFQNLSVYFCNSNEQWKFVLFNAKKGKGKPDFSTFILSRLNDLYYDILKPTPKFEQISSSTYLSYLIFVFFVVLLF